MSRYSLAPSPAQELALREHCAHARFVWNLCVGQEAEWRPGRGKMPRFAERCRQLSEARADNAAVNIAAGHAVTARGGSGLPGPVNREPQPVLLPAARNGLESLAFRRGTMPRSDRILAVRESVFQ
jgi:hypothetical protein